MAFFPDQTFDFRRRGLYQNGVPDQSPLLWNYFLWNYFLWNYFLWNYFLWNYYSVFFYRAGKGGRKAGKVLKNAAP